MGKGKLTTKQELFCLEYIKDFNASKAAIRSGYSVESAGIIGFENLKKPKIDSRIQEAIKQRMKECGVEGNQVLIEFAKIAYAKPHKMVKIRAGAVVFEKWEDIPEDLKDAIQSVKPTKFGIEIKFYDKLRALENLAKHLNLYTVTDEAGEDLDAVWEIRRVSKDA